MNRIQTELLLRKAQSGDTGALDTLITAYYPQILNYCRWHTADEQQAQDAAQETFLKAVAKRREGYAVVVLGFRPEDAARYGRLVVNNGELEKIVEFKDASDEEKAITLCNSGVMCFDGSLMFDILREIGNENAAHEYYLTDAVAIARARGLKCGVVECPAEEVAGANTREELALLEQYLMKREGK